MWKKSRKKVLWMEVLVKGTEQQIEKTLKLVDNSNNLIIIRKINVEDISVEIGDSGFGIWN